MEEIEEMEEGEQVEEAEEGEQVRKRREGINLAAFILLRQSYGAEPEG
jgi:hypothetical protein